MPARLYVSLAVIAALLASGCAFQRAGLVLDPIGPSHFPAQSGDTNGTLVVFSAHDPQADFNARSPYRREYTDYKICSETGQFLLEVRNDNGQLLEGPAEVALHPGVYRILAHANGYGLVTVPVVIVANEVTTVHLEGDAYWPDKKALIQSNPVRLPSGEIAGWRAPAVE